MNPEDYGLAAIIRFYTGSTEEHSKPAIADEVILTEEQKLILKRIIDDTGPILEVTGNWQDDNLVNRIPFWFDGEFELEWGHYYFAYKDYVVYFINHYTQIPEEDMAFIQSLDPKE